MIDMQNGVVLNAGFLADADVVHVAANRHSARCWTFADHDVADHLRAGIDVGGVRDAGHYSAISSNHESYRWTAIQNIK